MKTIQIKEFGEANKLQIVTTAIPKIKANEVLVKVKFAGINFIDIYQRKGYYPLELPHTLGLEASGTVVEVGAEVQNFKIDDKVAFAPFPKAYAEYVAIPAQRLIPVPENINFEQASALLLQGMTAHYLANNAY